MARLGLPQVWGLFCPGISFALSAFLSWSVHLMDLVPLVMVIVPVVGLGQLGPWSKASNQHKGHRNLNVRMRRTGARYVAKADVYARVTFLRVTCFPLNLTPSGRYMEPSWPFTHQQEVIFFFCSYHKLKIVDKCRKNLGSPLFYKLLQLHST